MITPAEIAARCAARSRRPRTHQIARPDRAPTQEQRRGLVAKAPYVPAEVQRAAEEAAAAPVRTFGDPVVRRWDSNARK